MEISREPNECKEVARQRRFDQRQARAWPVDQAHHRRGDTFSGICFNANQQVMRKRGERMNQCLVCMTAWVEAKLARDLSHRMPQARNLLWRTGQRGAGPDTCMN